MHTLRIPNDDDALLYLELSPTLSVLDARIFGESGAINNFLGMGVDSSGTVYIGYNDPPGGFGVFPEPSSLILAAPLGLFIVARRRNA